jgi:predicted protein tyrosine phosphatase
MEALAPFRISICGIPELAGHCEGGVSHVLSILDPGWPVPEAFGGFGEHRKLELRFHDIIETDDTGLIPPDDEHVRQLLAFGRSMLADAHTAPHLLVHCHAGVSRSTASMTLLLAQARPDASGERILREVLRIRPQAWPNRRILELGDAQLGRRGDLVAAAAGVYRMQLERTPELAGQMRAGGRGREVEAGMG